VFSIDYAKIVASVEDWVYGPQGEYSTLATIYIIMCKALTMW
jgi:hypothetical protein